MDLKPQQISESEVVSLQFIRPNKTVVFPIAVVFMRSNYGLRLPVN